MFSPKNIIKNSLVIFLSILIGVFIVEFAWSFLIPRNKQPIYNFEKRYMLFSDSTSSGVFNNHDGFFTYQPNIEIISRTYYDINNSWVKEYEYKFKTNNFGLVQSNNLLASNKSILFLGDSATEGQGSEPWFNKLMNEHKGSGYQFVNGGILGTGFDQWLNLEKYLTGGRGLSIQKLVVIYVSDDYRRGILRINPKTQECLINYKSCNGPEDFYGIPSNNEFEYLEMLKRNRSDIVSLRLRLFLRENFPALFTAINLVKNKIELNSIAPKNLDAVLQLNKKYGPDNIIFIHLPLKDEVINGSYNYLGGILDQDLKKHGIEPVNGYKLCKLNSSDFFVNDGHENSKGYDAVSKCVSEVIRNKWGI